MVDYDGESSASRRGMAVGRDESFFYVVLNERVVSYNSGRLGLYQDEMVNERLTGEESGVTNGYGLGNGVKYLR